MAPVLMNVISFPSLQLSGNVFAAAKETELQRVHRLHHPPAVRGDATCSYISREAAIWFVQSQRIPKKKRKS